MALLDIIKVVAPTIATALGGPLAGAAVSFLADKLEVGEKTQEAIERQLAGMKASDMVRLKELDLDFQKFMAENGIKLDMAQIAVNTEEAKSENLFVAGWRPAVGWVGAVSLFYVAIVDPMARFAAYVMFGYTGMFPAIDTTITMQVLFGILGLGAFRTLDKKWGNGNEVGKH